MYFFHYWIFRSPREAGTLQASPIWWRLMRVSYKTDIERKGGSDRSYLSLWPSLALHHFWCISQLEKIHCDILFMWNKRSLRRKFLLGTRLWIDWGSKILGCMEPHSPLQCSCWTYQLAGHVPGILCSLFSIAYCLLPSPSTRLSHEL